MNYCAIDIETSGLNHKLHDIIEFAAVLDDLRNPLPLDQLPSVQCYVKKDNYVGDPFALSMHAEIFRKIANPSPGESHCPISALPFLFSNFLSKNNYPFNEKKKKYMVNVAGKNASGFDLPFLNEKIKEWGDVQFRHRVLDVTPFWLHVHEDDVLPDLATCMGRAGLAYSTDAHTALADARMVVELVRRSYGVG